MDYLHPSGFPDGANNFTYVPDPTTSIDPDGLARVKVAEWYSETFQQTLSFASLAIDAATAGALAAVFTYGSDWDPVSAGLGTAGITAAATVWSEWNSFEAAINSQFPVGAPRVVGTLTSTDYQDIEHPHLISGPNPQILSVMRDWSISATAFQFIAYVESAQHWIYE